MIKSTFILTLLSVALLAWVSLVLFAMLFANGMIFPAPAASYRMHPPFFVLNAGDDLPPIAAIWLPATDPRAPVLLYSHGNGEDLGTIQSSLEDFHRRGWSVFAYEYPGYGPLGGEASEAACYRAAQAAWNYLVHTCNVSPEQIFLYGRSLGSGPSVELATKVQPVGLILEGAFTSTFRVMTRIRLLWWDVFNNLGRIDEVNCPVLVIHGDQDETVPFWHGERLFEQAVEPKQYLWVKGAGHNNLVEIAGNAYWDAITRFQRNHYQQ